jgi:acyl carrier protein
MKREEFFAELLEIIEVEDQVSETLPLESLEEWDSLASVTTLALFKKRLQLNVTAADMINCKTIGDILDLGKEKYE